MAAPRKEIDDIHRRLAVASHDNHNHHPRRRHGLPPRDDRKRTSGASHGESSRSNARVPLGRSSVSRQRQSSGRPRRVGLIPATILAVRRLRDKWMRGPLLPILGGLLVFGFIMFAGVWALTNKNAFDVYVGETYITSIAKEKGISEKLIFDGARAKLMSDMGASVQVDSEVAIVPANRAKNKLTTVDYAISAVYIALKDSSFKVEAANIVVNGVTIVTLQNKAVADAILEEVMLSYPPPDAVVVEKGWVDDDVVDVVPKYVEYSEIESPERAFAALTSKVETESMYQVRSGDNIWLICQRFGITHDRLIELNPGVPEVVSGNIGVGLMIRVVTLKPLCSVRTVEEVTHTDIEKRTVEERENNNMRRDQPPKVIQEGRDGTREVIEHVVRINGVETGERHEISSQTLVAPLVRIVEVGTQ